MRGHLLPLLLVLLAAAMPARAESVLEDLNRQLTDTVIVPGYERFAAATATLEAAMAGFCEAPTPERLKDARRAFEQAMLAWQHVQPIVFGPVLSGARTSVIQLFPDRRGAIWRQLSQALAAKDPELLAPGGLEGKSVALTGFPALEQILYDDARLPAPEAAAADADYACALAAAIARNLAGIAAGVLDGWQRQGGFRDTVLTAAAGNDAYFTAEDASGDLLKSLHTALQSVIALKLEAPLGASLEEAKPRRAESWRSGLSLPDIGPTSRPPKPSMPVPAGSATRSRRSPTRTSSTGRSARASRTPSRSWTESSRPSMRRSRIRRRAPGSRRCSPSSGPCVCWWGRSWRPRSACWSASTPWMVTDGSD
jgi:uncharacterized protein